MKFKKITAALLALALSLPTAPALAAPAAAVDIDSGLLLHYSFDTDGSRPSAIVDDSGNGFTGAVMNTEEDAFGGPGGFGGQTVSNVLTVQSGAARFPGSSETSFGPFGGMFHAGAAIKIPQNIKEELTGSFTVSMWVKADSGYKYHTGLQRLFDFGSDESKSVFLRYNYNDEREYGELRFQDRGHAASKDDIKSLRDLIIYDNIEDKWGLVTAVYDSDADRIYLYINGTSWSIYANVTNFRPLSKIENAKNDNYGFYLGRTQWWRNGDERANNPDFCGWMDDVRIYDRALSAEEVDALRDATYHEPDRKTIVSDTSLSYGIERGGSLDLPTEMNVTFDDGSSAVASVEWDEVPAEALNSVGTFTVRGKVSCDGEDYGKIASASVKVSSANDTLSKGLKVYYSFESDLSNPTEIKDEAGGYNGQVQNNSWRTALSVQSVAGGKAAVFPGASRRGGRNGYEAGSAVRIPESVREGLEDYTVSMWVKADSNTDFPDGLQRFFDFGIDFKDSIFVRYNVSTGELRFQDRKLGNDPDDGKSFISTTDKSFVDQWGLLTVTYSAADNTATVYVNGREAMSADKFTRSIGDIGELSDYNYGFYLGRTMWWNNSNQSVRENNPDFRGMMDEFRLYDRTLTAEEIDELYLTTCPEPMVTVTVESKLADGTVIDEKRVSVAEGGSYTYDAPAELVYGGETYSLSHKLSSLTVDKAVTGCVLTAVYIIKEVTGQEAVAVDAYRGTAPSLPKTVTLFYNTGDTADVAVSWDDVPENGWPDDGPHAVSGIADGYRVTATVTVYSITDSDLPETVYTDVGAEPELPTSTTLTASNGKTYASAVEWDALPADEVAQSKDFELKGRPALYPDYEITVNVKFILRAVSRVEAEADTYVADDNTSANHGGEAQLVISSTRGSGNANYNRYALLRFENPKLDEPISAKLKLYMEEIDNYADTTFTVYAFDNSDWDEKGVNMENYGDYTAGGERVASAFFSPVSQFQTVKDWLEFDLTDYIRDNPDREYYNFIIEENTCASYFSSREGGHAPALEIAAEGKRLAVNYNCGGKTVKSAETAVPKSGPFTFEGERAFVKDGRLYVGEGKVTVADTAAVQSLDIEVADTPFTVDIPTVKTYVGEEAPMPATVKLVWDGGETEIAAAFDGALFDEPGTYSVGGSAEGVPLTAEVKCYERWTNDFGSTVDYAARITVNFVDENGDAVAEPLVETARVGTAYNLDSSALADYPHINITEYPAAVTVTEPVYELEAVCEKLVGVVGALSGELSKGGEKPYDLTATARVINTGGEAGGALLVLADYSEEKKAKLIELEKIELPAEMTAATKVSVKVPYDRENEDIRAFLWDGGSLRPLSAALSADALSFYSDEILALIPDYDTVKENVLRANDYRQNNWSYKTWVNGIHPAFWDTAVYHTGNMEAYYTFGGDSYLEYALNWADSNDWKGNNSSASADRWTWGYNQSQGSDAVLFGDWQTCFQTYLDLGLVAPDRSDLTRVNEVMGYQITKSDDDFWWWADALYMAAPVMTKMYLTTGSEDYLDALYKYYVYAKELMYDGEGGCGVSADGDYANLFYRDGGYVGSTVNGQKNFWARGDGWVFAGLAKILNDLPADYERRDFFLELYNDMATAIVACQRVDGEGRGFWTQSMLANYPVGGRDNELGYETSGTALFTYGLFWGLNSGLLSEKTYLEPALRGWKYLSEVALLEDGCVGYCQAIGSNTNDTPASRNSNQPFGFGAFLLAGSEVSRWVGGVTPENEPYLRRKLWGGFAVNGSKYYRNGEVGELDAVTDGGSLWFSESALDVLMDASLFDSDGVLMLSHPNGSVTVPDASIRDIDGKTYVSAEFAASALGKHITDIGGATVFSHKSDVFYDCDKNSAEYLRSLLAE